MSASEKLNALDGEIHPEVIRSLGKYQSAHFVLAAALPQIMAVVKEAEKFTNDNGAAWPEIPVTLAALEDALP